MVVKDNTTYQMEAERFSFLKKVPLFASLTEEDILKISRGLKNVKIPRKEVICTEGEPGDSLYIIRSGIVTVSTRENGGEKILSQLYRGDFFGEISLLTGEPRSATVKAVLDVDLFVLSKADFDHITKDNPLVSLHLSRILSYRLKQSSSSIKTTLSPCFYSVIGSQKGVGASTFIGEIATILSFELKKRVLVVDLDGGKIKKVLNLNPASIPYQQLLEDIKPPDNALLLNCWFEDPSGVTAFTFPSASDKKLLSLLEIHLPSIMGILKKKFDYVFFDPSADLNPISRRALELSDRIFYLLANTLEGVNKAKAGLAKIKTMAEETSPSIIQVGISHLIGTTGLYRSRIKEILDLLEVPEIWVPRKQDKITGEGKTVTPKKIGASRKVARQIGGGSSWPGTGSRRSPWLGTYRGLGSTGRRGNHDRHDYRNQCWGISRGNLCQNRFSQRNLSIDHRQISE